MLPLYYIYPVAGFYHCSGNFFISGRLVTFDLEQNYRGQIVLL